MNKYITWFVIGLVAVAIILGLYVYGRIFLDSIFGAGALTW